MGNIVLLDDLTINKIAAGEVIERPASVVKEMVENSIDAGAKNITVEIKNGGISMIKVTDDGCGIAEDDMEIAFERHATSKIRSAADLTKVTTMGFRGEALASIAAVSKVEMVSKREDDVGHRIVVEGGKIMEFTEAARSTGTTITVQNLFYNTPVRYKFMKKDYTEAGYVEDVMTRIALVNRDISIKLVSNGKVVLRTAGNGSLKDVIYCIYGKDISEEINEVNYNYDDIHVTGAVGNPSIARGNRANQLFFLNGRYIKDKTLTAAADQSFKNVVPSGRYGFLVLNMEMRPDLVDVNVHPAKLEVRFQDEQEVFKAIYHAIEVGLERGGNTASASIDENESCISDVTDDDMVGTPISSRRVVDIQSNIKKDSNDIKETKKQKKGLFSKNKKDNGFDIKDDIENDPLAAIYMSRKEQMNSTDETDMLKVDVEKGIEAETELGVKEETESEVKSDVETNTENSDEILNEEKEEINVEKIIDKAEAVLEKSATKSEEKAEESDEEISKKIEEKIETEFDSKSDEDFLKESNTMSNQEKIAKFISDYHKSRHYNVEKLLKGEEEIIDETGNATEEDNKNKKNMFEDTTEFISRDKELEKLTTKELDSSEVNELVKSINQNEEVLNTQVTQIIDMASGNKSEEVSNDEEYDMPTINGKLADEENDEDNKEENEADSADVENYSNASDDSEVESITKVNDADSDNNADNDNYTDNDNEINTNNDTNIAHVETDDDDDIVNPYAININDMDSASNSTSTLQNTSTIGNTSALNNASSKEETSTLHDTGSIADENIGANSEEIKSNIFAKAKDELDKFASFAGTLINSKTEIQSTQLIDTKKVREAIGENTPEQDAPSQATFEESPEFAEMYKKTFGVEPFSVRKERRLQELEKEKMNATSEFSYVSENMNVFDDSEESEEDENVIPYKYIGQAFGSYIVIELKNEMYVVDIPACKVRLIYEDLKQKYYDDESEDSQTLLLPDVIIVSKKELRIAEENTEMFSKAGFRYEEFGENTIKLVSVPSVCEALNTKNLFVEILDNLDTVAITDTEEKEEKFISIIAQRIASNEIIEADEDQCKDMLSKLLKYKNPFTSQDGKPIAIKMTKYDLDKKFSRR